MILLPIMAGAAMALTGITLAPSRALAADVVCTPNASGVPLALAFTNCAGPGDGINFPSQTAVSSLVTLESLNISGAAAYGVTITTSGNNINVLDALFSGNITTATAGSDGFNIVGGGGSINLNLTNTPTGIDAVEMEVDPARLFSSARITQALATGPAVIRQPRPTAKLAARGAARH